MPDILRIGTRNSRLAMWQTDRICDLLNEKMPELKIEIISMTTIGDQIQDRPLNQIGEQGLFTKELEHALLNDHIDLAVHSMKDMESILPEGLKIAAAPEREDVRDALLSKSASSLRDLPDGSKILTGSLRRGAQLHAMDKNFQIEDVRGNVETRLRKFHESDAAGMIMAAAGLQRLELDHEISGRIPVTDMLPAVGQGALALEVRVKDRETAKICALLNDEKVMIETSAERSYLRVLQGGCRVPIAGYATLDGDTLTVSGFLAMIDGSLVIQKTVSGSPLSPEKLGEQLADEVLKAGGNKILKSYRKHSV